MVVVLVLILLGALFFVLRPAPEASRERTIDLSVKDCTMTPDEVKLGEGDLVTLRMTASPNR